MRRKIKNIGIALIIIISTSFWTHRSTPIKRVTRRIPYNPKEYLLIEDYIISPSGNFCQKSPYIIMIVTSYVGDFELRNLIRRGMPQKKLESMNSKRIFLLAEIRPGDKKITQNQIEKENENFHDILQGVFTESYRNLTLKHLMGLQWVATYCPNASYILKVDNDVVFRFERIVTFLKRDTIREDFVLGHMLNDTPPKRDNGSKWYVSLEEFPEETYPTYLSGWYYVTTPVVAGKLVNEAMYHPYFWVDDVLVTGILAGALNIRLLQLPDEFWFEYNLNVMIQNNKDVWHIEAYNYSIAIVNLIRRT